MAVVIERDAGMRPLKGESGSPDEGMIAGATRNGTKMSDQITKTDAEWRETLTDEQYRVLRKHGTERAGTSPLDREKRQGVFHCAGCGLALFASEAKFDSGTGWPSFFQPLHQAVETTEDRSWFMRRTDVHCRRCGGHLGHVFPDGPQPTGLRYCMNGVSMTFEPASNS